jgi:hypothetical protein
MRKLVFTFFYFSITCNCIYSQLNILPNTFFKGGEVLNYQLRYGPIIGGGVKLELKEQGENATYHLIGTAYTTGLADKLFRVKDIYESYFDKTSGLPVFAIQNVHEGKTYTYYNEYQFNQRNLIVTSSKSGEHNVPAGILDMMSVFYYVRRIDLSKAKEGDDYKLNTFFSDKVFPLEMRYRGKEIIETKWGKIKCMKFAPIVEPGRVFKSKDDMYIWYTDDENRIPILISMEMLVGHVYVEMTSYTDLNSPPVFTK